MIRLPWRAPLAVWAARGLLRHPGRSVLLFACLASVVALLALILLIEDSLSSACRRLTAQTPAIVVRRLDAGGWAPLPAAQALAGARSLAGVLRPRVRVWGVASGPAGPVTVVGRSEEMSIPDLPQARLPQPGQAWVGGGVLPPGAGGPLRLQAIQSLELSVVGRLPQASSMAAFDVALLHVDDARRLLGLSAGQASDLVLDVFHEEEAAALLPQLASAFDWPVQITTRRELLERYLGDISRRTGMLLLAFGPALLALVLLVAVAGAADFAGRWENGLLKALGWTGAELLRLRLYEGLLVGGPACFSGMAAAYLLLFWPGLDWLPRWLFDWQGPAPGLYLSVRGGAAVLALSAVLAGVPFLATVFWTGWKAAAADPSDCIERGP